MLTVHSWDTRQNSLNFHRGNIVPGFSEIKPALLNPDSSEVNDNWRRRSVLESVEAKHVGQSGFGQLLPATAKTFMTSTNNIHVFLGRLVVRFQKESLVSKSSTAREWISNYNEITFLGWVNKFESEPFLLCTFLCRLFNAILIEVSSILASVWSISRVGISKSLTSLRTSNTKGFLSFTSWYNHRSCSKHRHN